MPGQLDHISESIGELKGKMESLDRYTHDREHSINNLRQEIAGVGQLVTREVARLKAEIKGDFEQLRERVDRLEAAQDRQLGAKSFAMMIMQSPLVAWLFAIAVVAWTTIKNASK